MILTVAFIGTNAQKSAIIKFDKTLNDFGKIKEEGGKVVTIFTFTNVGTDTLRISEAKPSCSCTTADWTKTPIAPGQKGRVTADYDPWHRPGEFQKSVWVYSNATEPKVTLDIKGFVIAKIKTFADSFPSRIGNLMFSASAIYLKTINNKDIKKDSIEVFNASSTPMTIAFADMPTFFTLKSVPATVPPMKRGKIFIAYDAGKKKDFGLVTDNFTIVTNDTSSAKKSFSVTATITEDFTKLTALQKANAPKITFTSEYIDYGTVKEGDIVKKTFEFKNTGKDTLFIRKATPYYSDCKVLLTGKPALASGESGTVEIDFDTNGKSGAEQKRTIIFTTNDPTRSFVILVMKGTVTAK